MTERELYQQKLQAQLDEWKAELDTLRAQAAGAEADQRLELRGRIEALESVVKEGQAKLSKVAQASDEAWASIKDGVDAAWKTLKASIGDAASKFDS
jgi:chromosome segregation ATPase